MTASTRVGPLLQIFFTDYLVAQRRLSLQTVASYRDTFRLLLQFVHRESGIEPAALEIPELDAEIILRFLDALEKDRGNTVVSRNLRLTAIRSFYRMVALRDPVSVGVATRVLAIPLKRTNARVREYLTREEMESFLASIDRTQWCGRRDYALLLTMYNSGARVSEISGLRQSHVSFGGKSYVQLHGIRSERSIDSALAENRAGPEGLVARTGATRASNGIPEHSRRAADAVRYSLVVAKSGRPSISPLRQP
jgi:site-specific recombinase XerD